MQLNNIRFMAFPSIYGSGFVRADVLLPEQHGKTKQKHVAIPDGASADDVRRFIGELAASVAAMGFKLSQCKAPEMLPACSEPSEQMQQAIKEALA